LRTVAALIWRFRPLLAIVLLVFAAPGALAAPGPSLAALRSSGAAEVQTVYVRPPQADLGGQPAQVLLVLHGMGGNGPDFGGALAAQADARNWMIVAPTIKYGDWTDPNQIAREDPALIAWLSEYISNLSQETGIPVQPRVLLFGHSRGAQLALRFTEVHPEQAAGVAAVSAGTYTLPESTDPTTGQALDFPFGVGNLAQTDGGQAFDRSGFDSVPIWIAVGGADNNTADVPSAWTPYIGANRVQRAQTFASFLQSIGADVSFVVFPNTDHSLTDDMRATGCAALAAALGAG
jgi:pimeloyl-ACP methyl ester carboxylesterase